ncbi:MAG: hypothetical protein A3B74_02780 [Candidatus Kerfeldbacteria bacterium RIFCSPHIGHO2_02_FULL_42_14]|uniref:Bacterial type II secretion system protein E domain-containing protein n=1 Tax=Candidatus Kerfeldbacteria bacterium RIFCSPHIGHO2_02_FULL_42_14 TaxID=1798540 RepID=A0A1G2AS13_9BACT|nr:MAG: hypothetical protein A3B74_02780 [Candidatus Kerfeldbacteria bacterium RIFCSPHIGHO2_02_FULL_42_14]OGY80465.1 MAG: hypothetical protein A3E60_05400 [Candidatus Kerfeldbacteria bacterium RIFCSPHIGHO2_12_FULL_42_13]OGY83895.1 MAG: hypothetical protein A3I91_04925 [Candidatus Kerfeldbacteria bacterium RIFCSPLOWO2_02_FULL_42_19]OGY86566.1 MAG: hypothetical protein A3G01_04905 [Candidatus Kerfeldbacteria bacterium RIFCSPLOWO2_12_FULL_43_9]
MKKDDKQLILDILVKNNLLTQQQREQIVAEAVERNVDVLEVLEVKNFVQEEILAKIKSKIFNVPYINLKGKQIERTVLEVIPEEIARNYRMVAFQRSGDNLGIALANPQNFLALGALDFLARKYKYKFNYFITSRTSIEEALRAYYNMKEQVQEVMQTAAADVAQYTPEIAAKEEEEPQAVVKTAPVAKIVSVILRHAIEGKASDVHIEPVAEETRVRYRVDGKLNTSLILPKNVHAAIVARIKVLANLKLDETRLPQDGRFRMLLDGRTIDFRVSTMPLLDQEKVVIRILDTTASIFELERLGFAGRNLEVMKEYIQKPNGMFLVTGPTGSGKSTTLYTLLRMLNHEGINIITLEDPIEYSIAGVNQSQVKPEIGLTFANGLRSILRQDPDVIMVGEIRDNETAELAVHASLTGHIVLSTLHTNDALGALPRLIDMKVEPFLIASSLNVVIAQRLVRKICTNCRTEIKISPKVEAEVKVEIEKIPTESLPANFSHDSPLTFYQGKKCSRCEHTGYKGRIAMAEVVIVTPTLKNMLADGSIYDGQKIAEELSRQGMIPMRTDGILKALAGFTTIEEVLAKTKE